MPWNSYPRISDFDLYNFSGFKRLRNSDSYFVDTLRHFHGEVLGYPYTNGIEGFGNGYFNHSYGMRPYVRRYRSPSPVWRNEKNSSMRRNFGFGNRNKTKFQDRKNFYPRNRRQENGNHQENNIHCFEDLSREYKRFDSDNQDGRMEQHCTPSSVESTGGFQRTVRRSCTDVAHDKFGASLHKAYMFENGSLTSIASHDRSFYGQRSSDGRTFLKNESVAKVSSSSEKKIDPPDSIPIARSSSSGMTSHASSPNEADDCSSWYLPEEQEQIVEMLREVDLRHERQLVHDILVLKGEISRSDDSFNSSCDACSGDMGHQRSMSSEEEDDGVIILLPTPRVSLVQETTLEPPSSSELNVDLLNYFGGKLLERVRNDYFKEQACPFRDSPDKLICSSSVHKSNSVPKSGERVSPENARKKSPVEVMSDDLKKLLGIPDSEMADERSGAFSPKDQSTPKFGKKSMEDLVCVELSPTIGISGDSGSPKRGVVCHQKSFEDSGCKKEVKNKADKTSSAGKTLNLSSEMIQNSGDTKKLPQELNISRIKAQKFPEKYESRNCDQRGKELPEARKQSIAYTNFPQPSREKKKSPIRKVNFQNGKNDKRENREMKIECAACLRRKSCEDLPQNKVGHIAGNVAKKSSDSQNFNTSDIANSKTPLINSEYKRITVDEIFGRRPPIVAPDTKLNSKETLLNFINNLPSSKNFESLCHKTSLISRQPQISDEESLRRLLKIGSPDTERSGDRVTPSEAASQHLKQLLGIKCKDDSSKASPVTLNERKIESRAPLYTWKYSLANEAMPSKCSVRCDSGTLSSFSGSVSLPSVNYDSSSEENAENKSQGDSNCKSSNKNIACGVGKKERVIALNKSEVVKRVEKSGKDLKLNDCKVSQKCCAVPYREKSRELLVSKECVVNKTIQKLRNDERAKSFQSKGYAKSCVCNHCIETFDEKNKKGGNTETKSIVSQKELSPKKKKKKKSKYKNRGPTDSPGQFESDVSHKNSYCMNTKENNLEDKFERNNHQYRDYFEERNYPDKKAVKINTEKYVQNKNCSSNSSQNCKVRKTNNQFINKENHQSKSRDKQDNIYYNSAPSKDNFYTNKKDSMQTKTSNVKYQGEAKYPFDISSDKRSAVSRDNRIPKQNMREEKHGDKNFSTEALKSKTTRDNDRTVYKKHENQPLPFVRGRKQYSLLEEQTAETPSPKSRLSRRDYENNRMRKALPPVDSVERHQGVNAKTTSQANRACVADSSFKGERRNEAPKERSECYSSCEFITATKRTMEMGVCHCNRKSFRETGLAMSRKQAEMENFLKQDNLHKARIQKCDVCSAVRSPTQTSGTTVDCVSTDGHGDQVKTQSKCVSVYKNGEISDSSKLRSDPIVLIHRDTKSVSYELIVPNNLLGTFNINFPKSGAIMKRINRVRIPQFSCIKSFTLPSGIVTQLPLLPIMSLLNCSNYRGRKASNTSLGNPTSRIFFSTLRDYSQQGSDRKSFWSNLVANATANNPADVSKKPPSRGHRAPQKRNKEMRQVQNDSKKDISRVSTICVSNPPVDRASTNCLQPIHQKLSDSEIELAVNMFVAELESIYATCGEQLMSSRKMCSR